MKSQGSLRIRCLCLGLCLMFVMLCPAVGIAGSPTLGSTHRASGPPEVLLGDRDAWWDEPPDLNGFSMISDIIPEFGHVSETANDFYCESQVRIIEAVWWGEYFNGGEPNVSAFNLRFYEDAWGAPGSILAEYLEVIPDEVIDMGQGPDGPIFEYHAYMSVDLEAWWGYWFSVQACDHAYPPAWGRLSAGQVTGNEAAFRSEAFGYPDWTPSSFVWGWSMDASQRFYVEEVSGACCFADLHCESLGGSSCSELGGVWQGAGSACDPNPCPDVPMACCFPDGHCEQLSQSTCADEGGASGIDTICDPNPCPQPPMACCFPDGHCEFVTENICLQEGGFALGYPTTCDQASCPRHGACCSPVTGHCMVLAEEQCTAPSVWMGEGTACSPNPCSQPPSGSIVAWGANWSGQCDVPEPNLGFVAIASGDDHNLGLESDGSIVAWGANSSGQCNVPAPNTGFVAIAGGESHSLGLKGDGSILAWGSNYYGQCTVPVPNADFVAVSERGRLCLGLKSTGSIVAWGWNGFGQCEVPAPNADFVAAAAGAYHGLGLKADGSIIAWGRTYEGQCDVPFPNIRFVAVAAGGTHSLGLKADGSIVAWGDNSYGQCGVPEPNTGFVAIAAGWYSSLGLRANGSIVAWGRNDYGECNVPPPNTGLVAMAGGGYHTLGLTGPRGACCNPASGRCTIRTEEQCASPSVWMGPGAPCVPNPCTQPPGGAIYYVHSDGTGDFPTIQAAIDYEDLANNDVIELIGTPFTGAGNRDVNFHGRLVTVRSQSRDPDQCVIDCQWAGRGFIFTSGEDSLAVLEGITITRGYREFGGGGGIYISASSPWIKDCKITSCGIDHDYSGGGVYCGASAAPLFTGCAILGCSAGSSRYPARGGAGISSDASSVLTMRDCVVSGNVLIGGSGGGIACGNGNISRCIVSSNTSGLGSGGGIDCGTGFIESCEILGNHAVGGGAGCAAGTNTTIQDCVIHQNTADDGSGGVTGVGLTITNCAIINNSGSVGAIDGANLDINDCVITGNVGYIGAVRVANSNIASCTISSNCAYGSGEAGGLMGTDTHATQTILWGNTNTQNPRNNELVASNVTLTCCALNLMGASGSIVYEGPQVFTDPRFCAPEPCDGPPPGGDYTLRLGSPCLPQNSPCYLLIGALGLGCPVAGMEDHTNEAAIGLMPAKPNPFTDQTTIGFGLAKETMVDLAIFSVSGRSVRRLISRTQYAAGVHHLSWNRSDDAGRLLPSGVYVCRLRMGGEVQSSRLILLR